ncbi:hypothetical protein QR680_006925 [Steinernema hermaphroditum]|uniref:Uncharacterized protein n=1 Tax=Steinernema hermaphroditum TaxID=289476 RepID=A0AA39HWX5_9BILA|nr:hypothetical protein QR680_006925 [Steinernema hermaphroditum]
MEDYRSRMEKLKMNGAGVDRDAGEINYLSDEEELNKTGGAPAILSDEEDDSFSDSEVSSVESDCEAEQMNETTDEKAKSTLKTELRPRKRAEQVSEKLCLWKCAVCGKKIKGNWSKRRQHIGSHEKLCIACPIAKCTSEPLECNFVTHLKSKHKTTRKDLSTEQKAIVQAQIDRNFTAAIQCEMKYFPPSSLISSSETAGRDPVNPHCKKCGNFLFVNIDMSGSGGDRVEPREDLEELLLFFSFLEDINTMLQSTFLDLHEQLALLELQNILLRNLIRLLEEDPQ